MAGLRSLVAASARRRGPPGDRTSSDLLTINYTSGTTSRPKGVMITHRNAWMNSVGTLVHHPDVVCRPVSVDAADVPRERLDDSSGRSPPSGGAHVCLRRVDPRRRFERPARAHHDALCGADGADRARERAGRARRERRRAVFACSPRARRRRPRRSSASKGGSAGRSHMCTASPRRRRSSPSASRGRSTRMTRRARRDQGASRRGARHVGRAARRRRGRPRGSARRQTLGEIGVRGNVVMAGLLQRTRRPPRRPSATGGSTPAMPRSSIRTATSRSATA